MSRSDEWANASWPRLLALTDMDGPCMELFARIRRPGWDAWGAELPAGTYQGRRAAGRPTADSERAQP